jgi:hypothetical protein
MKNIIKEIDPVLAKENIENLNVMNHIMGLVLGHPNELNKKTTELLNALMIAKHPKSDLLIDLMALHIVTTAVRRSLEVWLINQESKTDEKINTMFV